MKHKVITVERGEWSDSAGIAHQAFASRCEGCDAITFGGFESRSAAREALRGHDTADAQA